MGWTLDNLHILLGMLLAVSELSAAAVQLTAPDNKGVSGILAFVIKLLQKLGAQDLDQDQ